MIDDEDLLIDEGDDAHVMEDGEEEDLLADVAMPNMAAWNWGEEPAPAPELPPVPAATRGPAPTMKLPATPPARGGAPTLSQQLDSFLNPVGLPEAFTGPALGTPPAAAAPRSLTMELDGFLNPPPTQAELSRPVGGRGADVELESLLEGPPVAATAPAIAVPADAGRDVPVLVVDPLAAGGDSPVEVALARMGFKPTFVETGGAARDELQKGGYPLAFLRSGADAGWARMLLLTSQERFPDVKFMASVPAFASNLVQQLIECGAADVMTEPLPPDATLLFHLQALVPDLLPSAAHSQQMMDEMQQLRARLTAAVAESEARAKEMAARAAEAEQRLQSVSNENTRRGREISSVRSELGVLKERVENLQTALERSQAENQALRTRVAELEGQGKGGGSSSDAQVGEIKNLLAALHPYGLAMDHALTYLVALTKEPDPSTDLLRHTKNLQLMRAVLKRLDARLAQL